MQNTAHVEKLEDIPGLPLLVDFVARFMDSFQENIPVQVTGDEVGKMVYSFSALLINYLGAGSSYATVLGMDVNSEDYRGWVKDTLKLLYLPLLRKMILGRENREQV